MTKQRTRFLSFWARALGACGLLTAATVPSSASAQTAGFVANRFEPSERGSEWFMLESLDFRGSARPTVGAVFDYMARPLVLRRDPTDSDRVTNSVLRNVYTLHPGFSFVLFERVRLATSMPVVMFQDSGRTQALVRTPAAQQAIGDIRVGADVRVLGEYGGKFNLALGAQLWLPTGKREDYTGDGAARLAPRVLVAGDLGMFVYSARVGFMYRVNEATVGTGRTGSELQFGAALGVRVAKRLVIGPEWYMNTAVTNLGADSRGRTDSVFGAEETVSEWLGGFHYTLPADFRFGAGAGTGLGRGYGSPELRVVANLEFAPSAVKRAASDRDRDGIDDTEDACPDLQGVRTDNRATNGCPPDRDGDGIADAEDACPDVPGERSDDPKKNGCAPDRDGDGIADAVDACPDVAGVASEDASKNGCPGDTDGDGILDNEDACVDKPGIKTDDPKTNGCPDPDRDKDGIPNDADACPDEPGKADADPKKNGCPKAFVQNGQIKILDQVKFKNNSAAIEPGPFSEEILQAVLEQVQKRSDTIKGIRIEGHTDNKGNANLNKTLSKNRANAVAQWLVNHGVDTNLLAVEGLGPDKPVDTNDTDGGRANNRRVEFHILDAAPEKPVKLKAKAPAKKK